MAMKFRDPKTGEVFEDIEKARTKFCTGKCSKCVLNDHASLLNCREYYSDSPADAARLMGLEVVEDAKALMRILGATGIERTAYGGNLCAVIGGTAKVVIDQGLFPSLRPGQAVKLEEVIV